ncbi:MAG: hypothetical protein HOV79_29940 [Hamadaea sp.]|nr:hypothetical protein [Hamadaea sp.]
MQHFTRVQVEVGGDGHRFLVDSGIGLTVISPTIANGPGVEPTGETFAAQRMSGQTVEVPLVRLASLRLGDHTVEGQVACVADLGDVEGPNGFAGIVGLGFFEGHAITTDARTLTLTVEPSSAFQAAGGFDVPLRIRRQGVAIDSFVTLVLPSGREVEVEVDTGSGSLILNTRFMADCGLSPDSPDLSTTTGVDETGHEWTRHWAKVSGKVHLAAAPETAHDGPRVQFQDIIYDGLIGTEYLERYRYTFDVPGERLVLFPHD